ncbi:MAG: alpha/beta fold hydrolase [Flavobacteriaceae bacterium]
MLKEKVHVYFMPGMAANPSIFKHIHLPQDIFESHWLKWFVPEKGMTMQAYAQRLNEEISHANPVLVGVSFGGMMVQEMAKHIQARKVIVVSSVKLRSELPKRMHFARYTKAHKLLPTALVANVELMAKYAFGETVNKRLDLYREYLSVSDKGYIDWALDKIVQWDATTYPDNLVHIQGERDAVFPITNIQDCIPVKNGTHAMVIHRAKWFNEHLPDIILK